MPAPPGNQNVSMTPAFLGLQSYSESQAGSFFGRDDEISKLTTLLQVNTLTIVFGKSGTGKTSLLNAGVFPGLRKNFFLPFRIRLEISKTAPDLVSQVKKTLKEEIVKYGFKVQSYPGDETLWEYFHKEPLWQVITPILVFDQFEEIFTLAKQYPKYPLEELPALWTELSDLIENNIPEKLRDQFRYKRPAFDFNYKSQKTKVVFAFREEYLPEFETITSKIPSIKSSRFRLLPMNGHQAYEVITRTWKKTINDAEAKKIVTYLTRKDDHESYDLMTVEPSLLSQVCAYIDEKRIEEGSHTVSAELLNRYPQEKILRSIYNEAIAAANAALLPGPALVQNRKSNPVKEFVEDKLINPEGFRTRHNLSGEDEFLKPGITVLAGRYLVREDNNVIELTHDALTPFIKTDRDFRRKELAMAEERRKAKEKQKKIILYSMGIAALIFLLFFILAMQENQKRIEAASEYHRLDSINKILEPIVKKLKDDSARLGGKINNKIIYQIPNETQERLNHLIADSISNSQIISVLKSQIENLNRVINRLNHEIEDLKNISATQTDTIIKIKEIIITKDKEYKELLERYNRFVEKYNELTEENKKLRSIIAELCRIYGCPPPPPPTPDTTNGLKLELTYSANKNYYPALLPDKLGVYLIPFTTKNMSLIKAASNYDKIDESLLQKAEGGIKGFYSDSTAPYFIFPRLKTGQKYLIKVATPYGDYEIFTKTTSRCEVKKIDAVPPVRSKFR